MILNENEINCRYQKKVFINDPVFTSNIRILANNIYNEIVPFFSIIIPIYNQENIIQQNLQSILNNTSNKLYEIILILDCCSDTTELMTITFINNISIKLYPLVTKILLLKSNTPLFETSADNLGCVCSQGEYILEIQADMEMTEYGYNMKLLAPFTLNENIIGISGRCCHSFDETEGIGKLGLNITKNLDELPNINIKSFYIGETCNRGPLLINHLKLKELKYFDEVNYFLDNSDHDLFARAYFYKKWICGYVPINFKAPLEYGSTRKPRDKINQHYYNIKSQLTNNGINGFLKKNIHLFEKRKITKFFLPT
jgi:glycosyltransferase involved in cell wall biosynthesis